MHRNIRLIAADMDGTLLNSRSQLTDFTISAIHEAQAKGIIFAICSGRYLENIQILLEDAGIDCPIVALNGCVVQDGKKRVHTELMPAVTVSRLYEAFERANASYYLFGPQSVTTRRLGQRHHSEISYARRLEEKWGVTFSKGKEAACAASKQDQFKYFVYQDFESCTMDEALEAAKGIPGIAFTKSGSNSFEVMPMHVDKRTGIEHLAAYLNIPMQEVMTLGDHDNDVPMLKAAGLGVAMGNAVEDAKRAAHVITEYNDDDGAAKAIIRFALQPSPSNR